MKLIHWIITAVAVVVAGVGLFLTLKNKNRRNKVANFFGSIGSGIHRYTIGLFQKKDGEVLAKPEDESIPVGA